MKRRICILLAAVLLSLVLLPIMQASADGYFDQTIDGVGYRFYYVDGKEDEVAAFVKGSLKPNVTGHVDVPSEVTDSGKTYKVTQIDIGAFNGCTGLTSITLPATVTEIIEQAFTGCTSLEKVTINGKVTAIGAAAFSGCTSLKTINLPDSLTSIAQQTFYNCGFTTLTIPGSLTLIPIGAFKSCTQLETLTLQEGVKTLAVNGPFASCTNLKTIYLPSTIQYIQAGAFQDCSSITDVYYNGSEADREGITIYESNNQYLLDAAWHYPISTATIADIGNQNYTGSEIKPAVTVTSASGTALVEGTDYTVSYKDNTNPGKATATVTGKGSYTGSESKTFSIIGNLSNASIAAISDQTYTGSALKPKPTVTFAGKTLTEGTDYTVSWKDNTAVGTATVTVTGKGYYTGTKSATFRIIGKLSGGTIAKISDQTYTGSALKPKPTVTFGGKTLTAGTDYTVAWKNNTAVGTATVTVTGKGYYTGTKSATFKIVGDLSKATVKAIDDQVYTGSAIKPTLTVKFGGKKLVKGTDYTVSFKDNVKPGKATVTITGKNAYKGKTTVTFTILPKKVKLVSVKPGKALLTVTWKKGAAITGYEIEYSLKKTFSASKIVKVTTAATVKTKIQKLKAGKTYYVRIRAYRKVGSKMYYSAWSDSMKATVPAK